MESNENREKETIVEIKYLQKVRQSKSIFQRFNCHDAVAERKRKGHRNEGYMQSSENVDWSYIVDSWCRGKAIKKYRKPKSFRYSSGRTKV